MFTHICLDEFQDTNAGQYGLLRALTGDSVNDLFVVADDDQVMYEWNGASRERIDALVSDYNASVLQLPLSYRCPAEVVAIANSLIQHNFHRSPGKQPIQAFKDFGGDGVVRMLPVAQDEYAEARTIAQDITSRQIEDLGRVAILGRSRRQLDRIIAELSGSSVPAIIRQRKDDFQSIPFRWLMSVLRFSVERSNARWLQSACAAHSLLVDSPVDPDSIVTSASASGRDLFDEWVRTVRELMYGASVDPVVADMCGAGKRVSSLNAINSAALDWFQNLALELGDSQSPSEPERRFALYEEEKDVWLNLSAEIRRSFGDSFTLDAFLQEMQLRSKEPEHRDGIVQLMTFHAAKGKEFPHVYIPCMVDDEVPSFQSIKQGATSAELEEERRNCFVAITRTVDTLTMSYASSYNGYRKRPSRFLSEMGLPV